MSSNAIAIIILAAGGSTRLGHPKQLVTFEGSTLLRRMAREAIAADLGPVIVVLGAEHDRLARELDGLAAATVINPAWRNGMATSIRAGLAAVSDSVSGCILATCDQYLVDTGCFGRLAQSGLQSPAGIAASGYANTTGVPAFFARVHFASLLALEGDRGARDLIRSVGGVAVVAFEGGHLDIDTPEGLSGSQNG